MMIRFGTDWRGPGRFSPADRARKFDYLSCWQTWTEPPIPGVPTLPVFSLTVYEGASHGAFTEPWGLEAYNRGFFMEDSGGYFRKVWTRDDGTARTIALDPTKRGFVGWLAPQIVKRFAWAQGILWDYYSDLAWLFSFDTCQRCGAGRHSLDSCGIVPNQTHDFGISLDYWVKYRAAMESLAGEIRRLRPDWIIVGQNFHFPKDTGGMLDGLFLEQTPTMFGQTLAMHAERLSMHRELMKLAGRRPSLWVAEIREPARIKTLPGGETYLLNVKAWCEAEGVALSFGRDAAAGVGFPA